MTGTVEILFLSGATNLKWLRTESPAAPRMTKASSLLTASEAQQIPHRMEGRKTKLSGNII